MTTREELRRAPRTAVDVEAELQLADQPACRGVIQDLSILGSLFMLPTTAAVKADTSGRLRFALPSAVSWIEPTIHVRRVTTFTRDNGDEAQAIGFEFSGLDPQQERAIAAGCLEWSSHRQREYMLKARCFVTGVGEDRQFSRFGRLVSGSRGSFRVSLPSSGELRRGSDVRIKVDAMSVAGTIEDLQPDRSGVLAVVRTSGWGSDFVLHEARRDSLSDPAGAPRYSV